MEYLLLGVLAGTVAGIVPGIGVFASLLILYPWLTSLNIIDTFVFYLALTSTTQYIGSVSATILGVPGEASSLPAIYEGHTLFKKGRGATAISGAAMGSLVGGFIVLGLITLVAPFLYYVHYFFNTYAQAIVLYSVLFLMLFYSNKSFFISLSLCLLGFGLGLLGCTEWGLTDFKTRCITPPGLSFVEDDLSVGLPLISVIAAIYVIPQLLHVETARNVNIQQISNTILEHFKYYYQNISSSLRGTIIGFWLGFTPGGSTVLSSNTAHRLEVKREKAKGTYEKGNYRALIAAETANNAAAFTTLVPLLALGIPFAASEALFYDIITAKGFSFMADIDVGFFMKNVAYSLVWINILAFFIAWPFAKYISYIYKVPPQIINLIVFIVLTYVIYHVGSYMFASWYYLGTFLSLLPLGYLLRKYDTMPLIFVFILHDRFIMNGHTIIDLVKTL